MAGAWKEIQRKVKHPSYTTIGDMSKVVTEYVLPAVPNTVTKVVGIPRSGLLPAMVVSFARHIRLGALGLGNIPGGERTQRCMPEDNGDVLLIDDTVSRGNNMQMAAKQLEANGRKVIRACVFLEKGKEHMVDIFGAYREHPRLFEWNLFNHGLGPNMMFDMDGVFCTDPLMLDDDSEKFGMVLGNALPLRLPKWPIGVICTNRIEKWRGVTEDWLKRHGVKYRTLLMNPAPTAAERRKHQLEHKVNSYKMSGAVMFVESSKIQAEGIARLSGRPVLSLEDNMVYYE